MADVANPRSLTLDPRRVAEELEFHIDRDAGETFDVRREAPDSNITGYVVRTEFRGVAAAERYRWVAEFFEDRFGDLSQQMGLVFAFTPEEFEGWLEDRDL